MIIMIIMIIYLYSHINEYRYCYKVVYNEQERQSLGIFINRIVGMGERDEDADKGGDTWEWGSVTKTPTRGEIRGNRGA